MAVHLLAEVITGLSRTTLALAAVNFGVRVLPDWWSLGLTNSVPRMDVVSVEIC